MLAGAIVLVVIVILIFIGIAVGTYGVIINIIVFVIAVVDRHFPQASFFFAL